NDCDDERMEVASQPDFCYVTPWQCSGDAGHGLDENVSCKNPSAISGMKHQPELVRVAASPIFMLTGVAVLPRGRVFASFPRWTSLAAPSVMEAMPDGSFEPYPF